MKKLKKLAALVLAAAMVLAMGMTSFAAGGTGKITIVRGDHDLSGVTYKAYRVMDATVHDDKVAYTISDKFEAFFTEKLITTDEDAYDYLDDTSVETVLNDLETFITEQSIQADGTGAGSNAANTEIESLPYGYYIVIPTGGDFTANLVTVKGHNQDIYVKGKEPTAEKTVDGEEWTSAQVGDEITFTVTSTVPDMTGQTEYYFTLTDTMSKGLTVATPFQPTVHIGDITLTQDEDFTATATPGADGVTNIKIEFKNFITHAADAGKTITFTYKATLNENAITTNKETNSASVNWGNDPNSMETSTPDTVIVKDYDLTIKKTDGENRPLPGAEFQLFRGDRISGTAIKFVDRGNGAYEVATQAQITGASTNGLTITDKVVSPDPSGEITIKGLDADTYTLHETKAPDGYNKAADKTIIITASSDNKGETVTVEGNKVTVVNEAGTLLPETGGMGTVIFTAVAVLLILGVAGSFVISRRRSSR